ncbi:MAG TPA: carbohydrate kinase family protein [Thermotogota bacterium]|nr:carbohydrate kinase family protein [Thermotogota bacterium]
MKKYDVCVVGAFGVDTSVYLNHPLGEMKVETQFVENLDNVGLSGGYCSQLFSALGKRVRCIGYCGDDFCGDFLKRRLKSQGIDTEGFFTDTQGTKRSVNLMCKDGSRKSFYDGKGSMKALPDMERCAAILRSVKIAHFSIVNWTRYLLDTCADLGITLSVDLQDAPSVSDAYRLDYVNKSNILFVSGVNLVDPKGALKEYIQAYPNKLFIMSVGKNGVLYHQGNEILRQPAIEKGAPVVDPNGAGDSLAVGFLTGYLLEGLPLEDSLRMGQSLARHTCTIRGNTAPFMSREMLRDEMLTEKQD